MTEAAAAAEPVAGSKLSIAGLLLGFITGLPQLLFPILAIFFGTGQTGRGQFLAPFLIAAILAASLLFRWIGWMRFRYYTDDEDIRIESGLMNRSARSIPYERIQDVGIEQKPLARLFGLGEVRFETGGGAGDEAKLSYVTLAEAERLRGLVRAYKSGPATARSGALAAIETEGAAIETENDPASMPIFAMDAPRVLTLGLYSFSLVIFAIVGGAAQQFDFLLPFDQYDIGGWRGLAAGNEVIFDLIGWNIGIFAAIAGLFGLIVIGCATGIIRAFLREYRFRLDVTPRGFRRRRGLLTLTDVILPIHRVQAAAIYTGPIRKRAGWYGLKFISLAGDSGSAEKRDRDHVVAPLATMAEVEHILAAAKIDPVDPQCAFLRGHFAWWLPQLVAATLVIMAGIVVLVMAANAGWKAMLLLLLLPLALVSAFLQWRYGGYAIQRENVAVRSGWWRQQTILAQQIKIQTVDISQGPISRLQGLCKIRFGIAGGSLSIPAVQIADARMIAAQIAARVAAVDYSKIAGGNDR